MDGDGVPVVLDWVVQADHAPAGGRQGVKAPPSEPLARHAGRTHFLSGPSRNHRTRLRPRSRQDGRGQGGRSGWPLRQADAEEVQQGPGEGRQPGLTRGPGPGLGRGERVLLPLIGRGVGVHEPWPTWEKAAAEETAVSQEPSATLSLTRKGDRKEQTVVVTCVAVCPSDKARVAALR